MEESREDSRSGVVTDRHLWCCVRAWTEGLHARRVGGRWGSVGTSSRNLIGAGAKLRLSRLNGMLAAGIESGQVDAVPVG
jgi:hypothetical protein